MNTIKFQGSYFPVKKLNFHFGMSLVATTDLNRYLFDVSSFDYFSSEAQIIDEQIYYFVEPHQIRMKEGELMNLIMEEIQQ